MASYRDAVMARVHLKSLILRCPAPAGPPWGVPVLCQSYCINCIRLPISNMIMLWHARSFVLPARCLSCMFLASRSMIAQVLTVVIKPIENHTFLHHYGSHIGPLREPLKTSSGASLGGPLGPLWELSGAPLVSSSMPFLGLSDKGGQ